MASELQVMVGHPIDRKYKHMVSNKLILNFPITIYDITNLNYMSRPDLSGVMGNTVRNKPSRVETGEYVNIPDFFKNYTSL